MTTLWERIIYSVSMRALRDLLLLFVNTSPLSDFEIGICNLITLVSGHCISFYFTSTT